MRDAITGLQFGDSRADLADLPLLGSDVSGYGLGGEKRARTVRSTGHAIEPLFRLGVNTN